MQTSKRESWSAVALKCMTEDDNCMRRKKTQKWLCSSPLSIKVTFWPQPNIIARVPLRSRYRITLHFYFVEKTAWDSILDQIFWSNSNFEANHYQIAQIWNMNQKFYSFPETIKVSQIKNREFWIFSLKKL